MAQKLFQVQDLFNFQPKSSHKAGSGLEVGTYPFFTSSQKQTKWFDTAEYKEESLILGTGGAPSVHCASNFATSTDVFVLRPKDEQVSARYVYFYLLEHKALLERGFKGAGLKHLSTEYVKKMLIPFPVDKDGIPDLREQGRIVALMDEAEELKQKRLQVDEKMATVIPALFNKMFGNSGTNSGGWEIASLGEGIVFITSGARGWAKYYSTKGSKYIRIQNVKNAELTFDDVQYVQPPESAESKRIKVENGDLLISITADLGRTAVVDAETANAGAYINQHLALIRLSAEFNAVFVAHYLESSAGQAQFLRYGQAASKKGLNFDSLKALRVPKPPIALQNQFAEKVSEILKLKKYQRESAMKITVMSSALSFKTFTLV